MGEEAWKEYQKERNRQKQRKAQVYLTEYKNKLKRRLVDYKGGKCEKCGYNKDSLGAFHFHHKDSKTKEFAISQGKYSFDKLKAEVDKCQLLCANCHAEEHDIEYAKMRAKTKARYEK